jgi:hypothetical protein
VCSDRRIDERPEFTTEGAQSRSASP